MQGAQPCGAHDTVTAYISTCLAAVASHTKPEFSLQFSLAELCVPLGCAIPLAINYRAVTGLYRDKLTTGRPPDCPEIYAPHCP